MDSSGQTAGKQEDIGFMIYLLVDFVWYWASIVHVHTWKGTDPMVRSIGRFPGAGLRKTFSRNFLHPKQPIMTYLVNCLSRGIQ